MEGIVLSKGFLDEEKRSKIINSELEKAMTEPAQEKIASAYASAPTRYPSPFLNLSDMHLPQSTTEVFKWCKYYYTFDPLISGAVNALATFPVTEVLLEDNDADDNGDKSETFKLYERILFKNLNIYKLLIEIGIDYHLYGNCFVMGEMTGKTRGEKEWSNIMRLDPSKMKIDYNPTTGEKTFRWDVPDKIKQIVRSRKPEKEYAKIPDLIKQAVLKNKTIVLNNDNIYHFSRATDSMGDSSVWGVPIVANVLKLLMYRNVLRQAQEAIAREHIVPMRIFYLDRTNSVNPHADFNKVAAELSAEIQKSVRDPNYKVVSPLPVNVINVGGDGRSLLLTPEIEQIQSEILAGMNVPREFIFGGVSYSGSSISLRILENQFITYRLLLRDFIQNFIIKKMAVARGEFNAEDDFDILNVKLSDLKMQDDVQQKQLVIQLNSAGKCSNDYMWKAMSIDSGKMKEAIEREALEAVALEGKVKLAQLQTELASMDAQLQLQMKQMQMQMQLQAMQMQMQQQMQQQMAEAGIAPQEQAGMQEQMQEQPQEQQEEQQEQPQAQGDMQEQPQPQEQPQEQDDNEADIQNIAIQLVKMSEKEQTAVLQKVPMEYRQAVVKRMEELKNTEQAKESVDMRAMPEQRPPRRQGAQ